MRPSRHGDGRRSVECSVTELASRGKHGSFADVDFASFAVGGSHFGNRSRLSNLNGDVVTSRGCLIEVVVMI